MVALNLANEYASRSHNGLYYKSSGEPTHQRCVGRRSGGYEEQLCDVNIGGSARLHRTEVTGIGYKY